jgi:hypothetical protein
VLDGEACNHDDFRRLLAAALFFLPHQHDNQQR